MKKLLGYTTAFMTSVCLMWAPMNAYAAGTGTEPARLSFAATSVPVMFIIAVLFCIAVILIITKASNNGVKKTAGNNPMLHFVSLPQNINSYMAKDPNFSPSAFKEKVLNTAIRLEQGITNKDISDVMPCLTDSMKADIQRHIDQLRRKGQTHQIDRFSILSSELRGWTADAENDIMLVKLNTRCVDYYTNDSNGSVVKGSFSKEVFTNYELRLKRRTGAVTEKTSGTHGETCPKCGAHIDTNRSAVCEFCGAVMETDILGWKLDSVKKCL